MGHPREPTSRLLALPTELLLYIASYLSIQNLYALVQVSPQTFGVLNQSLYLNQHDHSPGEQDSPLLWAAMSGNLGTLRRVVQYSPPGYLGDEAKRDALMEVVESGDEEFVRVWLEQGWGDRIRGTCSSALQRACENGHFEIVEMLLDAGWDITTLPRSMTVFNCGPEKLRWLLRRGASMAPTDGHRNILPDAAGDGNVDLLEQLLDYGAEIDGHDGTGKTALVAAIRNRHVDAVRLLLSRGANPNLANDNGATAMHTLATAYDAEIYTAMVQAGADINATDRFHRSPLLMATRTNESSPDVVRRLIEDGAQDLTRQGCLPLKNAMMRWIHGHETVQVLLDAGVLKMEAYQTPLILVCAAARNYPEIVQQLLDAGVDPNTQSEMDQLTPLMVANSARHERVFHLLLPHIIDFEVQSQSGRTALSFVLEKGSKEMIRLLMERTSDVDSPDYEGNTPLIYAAIEQDTEVVSWVLRRCNNVSQAGTFGKTALHYAVERDEQQTIRLLLERGAATNVYDVGGWTPLVMAVQQQHVGAANILLGWAADRTGWECWESTKALHWAVDNQQVPMVELLLQYGVDPDAVERPHSKTPLMLALDKGNEELAHLFLRYGARPDIAVDEETALMHAVRRRWETLVISLLSKGLDINLRDGDGTTVLLWAAIEGDANIVRILLENGASPHTSDNDGCTPLAYASITGHTEIVRLLVERGAEVNCNDMFYQTPLTQAAINGHGETVSYLLLQSANVDHCDHVGRTALAHAAAEGDLEATEALLRHGAGVDLADKYGRTPLSLSAQKDRVDVAKALIQAGSDVTRSDADKKTPLSWALDVESDAIVRLLYERLCV